MWPYSELGSTWVTSLVRTAWLAAAPLSVWQAHGCATLHGVPPFSGRRGSGAVSLVAQAIWSGTHHRPARLVQRPSVLASVQRIVSFFL